MFSLNNGQKFFNKKYIINYAFKFLNTKIYKNCTNHIIKTESKFCFNKIISRNFARFNKNNEENNSDFNEKSTMIKRTKLSELDKEAFREEIKFLMENEKYKEAEDKLSKMLNYYLTCEKDEDTLDNIYGITTILTDVYDELERLDDSIEKKKYVMKFLEGLTSDKAHQVKIQILDEIAFDYTSSEEYEKAIEILENSINLIEKRIEEDKLSLIEDKCSLASNLLNLANLKMEIGRPKEEILEDLKRSLQIFKEHKNKLEGIGFKLFRSLGMINYNLSNYKESIEFLEESLKFKKMEGEEEDEDCYYINKLMADCHLELDNRNKFLDFYEKSITIKEKLIQNLSPLELLQHGRQHYIDIARIYETLGEDYHEEMADIDTAEGLIQKAMDNYLKFNVEPIYLAKCYFMLAEILLEKKEFLKSLEYSKKYIFAFEKFLLEHKEDFLEKDFDLEYYTRVNLNSHHSMIYKSYKYITIANFNLNDKENVKKFGQMAIDKLNELNFTEEDEDEIEINDYLNYKYEIIRMKEMMGNDFLLLVEYEEILKKLKTSQLDKIPTDLDDNLLLDKNYFIIDALYGKVDILIKLDKFEEAKKNLAEIQEIIRKNELKVEEERLSEINNKVNVINIKLRLKAKEIGENKFPHK